MLKYLACALVVTTPALGFIQETILLDPDFVVEDRAKDKGKRYLLLVYHYLPYYNHK